MGWLLYLKAWICIFLIASNHCIGNDVIQFNNQTFVKTGEILVNVFEKDLIESQLFEIDYQSFTIPIASSIDNVTDDNIKMQLLTYSTQITDHSNDRILKKINAVFKYDAGGHQRQRRVVPIFAIAGFFIVSVLIMSTAYVLYETKKELHAVEQNLNEVSLELAKLTRIVNVDKYIANFKFNLNSYIATTESLIIDFLQHLSTGETILLESLPATILNQFKNFNVKNQNNRFYFLKLQQATKNGIVIEIKAVHGQKGDNIDCHKYINMGYFEANIFHRYLMDSKYICYRNATCFQVQANQCTSNFDHFNCTKDSLHTCSCDQTDLSNCQIESEIASSNFVFVQQFKQFVVASTNAKTYTISRSTGSSTKTVGGSGVLVTSLNEYDSLIIGGVTVRGRSKDPTKIYGFIHTEFTVAPLPTTQAPKIYTYDKDGIADFVFDWWIHIVCVLALIVFVIVFYKKCM